jgi:transcriptional regulator with XRE-family HTH domain
MRGHAKNEPQAFGALLRRHRVAAGLTQERLAERAGLSVRGLADLERGARRFPYQDTVQRLADALALAPSERADLAAAARRNGLAPVGVGGSLGNERAHNRTLVLGGPQAASWRDVIAVYERLLGRPIEVHYRPLGEPLPGFPDFISGLVNALETYDSDIDMQPVSQEFQVQQVPLESSIRLQLTAATANI